MYLYNDIYTIRILLICIFLSIFHYVYELLHCIYGKHDDMFNEKNEELVIIATYNNSKLEGHPSKIYKNLLTLKKKIIFYLPIVKLVEK